MNMGSSNGALKGRILAIIILTVVSGGSFVLGYLVGTSAGPKEYPTAVEMMPDEEALAVQEPPGVTEPQEMVREETAAIKSPATEPTKDTATVKKRAVKRDSSEHYSVQAGVFGERSYAESFAGKLRNKGYSAYIQDSSEGGGIVYKVKVGRFASREEAAALARKLKEAEGIEGFVTGPG